MKIGIGNDHVAVEYKKEIKKYIEEKYPESYRIEEDVCESLGKSLGKELDPIEIGYLAMHIERTVEQ